MYLLHVIYAMAALLGISITVSGVHEESLQGDVEFVHILEKWAASVKIHQREFASANQ